MTHTPSYCTVRLGADGTTCAKPAVWSNGEFAECEQHAQDAISLSKTTKVEPDIKIGTIVAFEAYGLSYAGRVIWVGRKNAEVEFRLRTGKTKTLKLSMSKLAPLPVRS